MSESIRVCVLANAGLGGTEKAATIFAANLVARGYAVDYWGNSGPRESYLRDRGVRTIRTERSSEAVRHYIETSRPHIIHQHVPGYPTENPLYQALIGVREELQPKVIETNVFGRLEDPEGAEIVDFRFFISAASAAQAFRRAHLTPTTETLGKQTVLYYPVNPPNESVSTVDPTVRRDVRRELNIAENEVLAVRIGRPGHKWAAWECEAYGLARKESRRLRLFLMEPPEWLCAQIKKSKYGNGIIVRKETSEFAWLQKLYASADLMIHASDWGESFGYTIAEGMAAELPVITRSTPWCDNAQVELVRNNETGFVCWSVPEMARRLVELANNEGPRRKMGTAAQQRILSLANPKKETDLLEAAISFCLGADNSSILNDRNAQLLEFSNRFAALERDTSERCSEHPIDFARACLYYYYRASRAHVREILNHLERRFKIVRR